MNRGTLLKSQSTSQSELNTEAPPGFAVVLIIPCGVATALAEPDLARWLARSRAGMHAPHSTLLTRLLAALRLPAPAAAPAAIRLWGDTGVRPDGWVAAADPVWMQAGLDKLFLQVPPAAEISPADMARLLEDLNEQLFSDSAEQLRFERNSAYLCGGDGLPTAAVPASAIAGEQPNDWLPEGPSAARYFNITGELQMAMHEHPVNRQREDAGLAPINALWLWGGGVAAQTEPRSLPPIYADDPVLRGYGYLSQAPVQDWPGSLQQCATNCIAGSDAAEPLQALRHLAECWRRREVRSACVLFDDVRCDFTRGWRSLLSRSGPERLPGVLA